MQERVADRRFTPAASRGQRLASALLSPYREGLGEIDRRAYLVVTLTLLAVAARMSIYTFLGIYLTRDAGLSIALVGVGLLLENVVRGLVSPLTGALSDRVGRRRVIAGAALAVAGVLPLFLLIRSPLAFLAWSAAMGAAQAGLWPATTALLLELAPPNRHQVVLSLNYTAISIGYPLGVIPAGFLAEVGFGALAAAGAAGFVVIALLATLALREPAAAARTAETRSSVLVDAVRAPRDPAFLSLGALGIVFPLGIGLIAYVTPLYASDSGLAEGTIGLALALNGPLLALLAVPVAVRLARRGPYRYLALSASLLALSYLPLVVAGSFAALLVATLLFTAGELVFSNALPAAVAALAPHGRQGAYQGAWAMVVAVGIGGGMALTGLLRLELSWPATWLAWVAVTAVAAIGLALARARFERASHERSTRKRA
jgi:predicted MFS family arabinose efflux permease